MVEVGPSAVDNASSATIKIGEIIEASTTEFVAESYELHSSPPLGALLRTSDGPTEIYAVACHTRTGSIDPGRRPIARGRDDDDEDEIYRRHPGAAATPAEPSSAPS